MTGVDYVKHVKNRKQDLLSRIVGYLHHSLHLNQDSK
jgi:hypothetical protein